MSMESKYTSTGAKFWLHSEAMEAYRAGDPHSIISTHVSPTARCNLSCDFCSVSRRDQRHSIPMQTIRRYIETLMGCGLKAVILTGGGEPLMYEDVNDLVRFLAYDCGLELGLITNGTACDRLRPDCWGCFSWVRVSLNHRSIDRINIIREYLVPECVLGGSVVYAGENQNSQFLRQCSVLARDLEMRYVRVLPNCLLDDAHLYAAHSEVKDALADLDDDIFFRQDKNHGTPRAKVCHQSFFRPYLSEAPHCETGNPGSVYPCDSVVLNDAAGKFEEKYQLCHADDVGEWLENGREAGPVPCEDCQGCIFWRTVNMLDDWKQGRVRRFDQAQPTEHENFV